MYDPPTANLDTDLALDDPPRSVRELLEQATEEDLGAIGVDPLALTEGDARWLHEELEALWDERAAAETAEYRDALHHQEDAVPEITTQTVAVDPPLDLWVITTDAGEVKGVATNVADAQRRLLGACHPNRACSLVRVWDQMSPGDRRARGFSSFDEFIRASCEALTETDGRAFWMTGAAGVRVTATRGRWTATPVPARTREVAA